ncbi:MAG: FHA domain-containing protein [Deltaproteobacteria bacterium]|nr:FHA domain-containing protein [Deltaproteobacteria bacterium]
MLSLVIRDGKACGTTYRLGTRVLTIGRGPQNPVQLVDGEVSRRHALIRWTGSGYAITDLRSHNGTFVRDQPLGTEERELVPGDTIRLGKTVLEVVADDRSAPDAVLGAKLARTAARAVTMPSASDRGDGVIDADAEADRRAMRTAKLAASLKEAVRAGRHKSLVYKQALLGLLGLVGADRVAAFRLVPEGEPAMEASATNDELPASGSDASWARDVIRAAGISGRAVLSGVTSAGAAETDDQVLGAAVHGSILAVPVLDEGAVVGVLYADAASKSSSLFVRDDVEVLEVLARALAPAFSAGRKPSAVRLAS